MGWKRRHLTPIPDSQLCIRCRAAYRQDGKYCRLCHYIVNEESGVKSVDREAQHVEAQRAKLEKLKPEPPRVVFKFVTIWDFAVKDPATGHYGMWVEYEVWNGHRWSTDQPLEWEKPLALRNDPRALSAGNAERRDRAVDPT